MSRSYLPNIFFAGVRLDARVLCRSLRIGSYYLKWDSDTQLMTLSTGDNEGILCVTCPRESAAKFAQDFGFPECGPNRNEWSIYVPSITFYDDNGSTTARMIREALIASELPFRAFEGNRDGWTVTMHSKRYMSDSITVDTMVDLIREEGRKYASVIALFNRR